MEKKRCTLVFVYSYFIKEQYYININIIQVGFDVYGDNEFINIEAAVRNLRGIYSQVNMGIGRVEYHRILTTDTPGFHNIQGDADATLLTMLYTIPNDGCDVFLVLTYKGDTIGISERNGPCNKDEIEDLQMTGSVIAIQETSDNAGLDTGHTIAHEVGHYLGLPHSFDIETMLNTCLDAETYAIYGQTSDEFKECLKSQPAAAKAMLMFPSRTSSNQGTRNNNNNMTSGEGNTIKTHCFSHLPCV